MSRAQEIAVQAIVAILLGIVALLCKEVVENGKNIAALQSEMQEQRELRSQGYARLAVVEQVIAQKLPELVDRKLSGIESKLESLSTSVGQLRTQVTRLETQQERK